MGVSLLLVVVCGGGIGSAVATGKGGQEKVTVKSRK